MSANDSENEEHQEETGLPICSLKLVSAISGIDEAIVNISMNIQGNKEGNIYRLYGQQCYNLNDALKKEEDYQLLQVIGKNLCGDNEEVNIDLQAFNCLSGRQYRLRVAYVNGEKEEYISDETIIKTPAAPPQKPTNVIATATTNTSFVLKWGMENDNGSIITHYKLEAKESDASMYMTIYTGKEDSFEYKNLKPSTTYCFRVKAMSSLGCSEYSNVSEIKTYTSITNPPRNLTISDLNSGGCYLEWKEPEGYDEKDCPANYMVEISENDDWYSIYYNGPKTRCEFRNLLSNTEYFARVSFVNLDESLTTSDKITFRTEEMFPSICNPPIISDEEGAMNDNNQLELTWSIVDESIIGVYYQLEMCLDDGNNNFTAIYNGQNTYFDVIGLNAGETYLFRVCAYNNIGRGPYSSVSRYTIEAVRRSTISGVKITSITPTTVSFEWDEVEFIDAPVSTYQLFYKLLDDLRGEYNNNNNNEMSYYEYNRQMIEPGELVEYFVKKGMYRKGIFNYVTDDKYYYLTDLYTKRSMYKYRYQIKRIMKYKSGYINKFENRISPVFRKAFDTLLTRCTVKKLLSGHHYAFYIFAKTTNGQKKSSETMYISTPMNDVFKPNPPELKYKTSTSLTLKWSDDGSIENENRKIVVWILTIDNYSDKNPVVYSGTDTEYTVNDLSPGRAYRFILFCKTSSGYSEGSDTIGYCTLSSVPPRPNPPMIKTEYEYDEENEDNYNNNNNNNNENSIKLEWSFPMIDNGHRIDKNILMMSEDNKNWKEIFSGRETEYEMKSLESGKEYYFQLFSHNLKGKSEGSKIVKYKTNANTPLSPLAPILSSPPSANSISLQWNKPKDNGSEIQYYIIENDKNENCSIISNTKYTIEDLKSETNYRFRVYAVNSAGKSSPSEWSKVIRTLPKVPSKLPPITFDKSKLPSIIVKWSDGNNNCSIDYYVLEMSVGLKDTFMEIYSGPNQKILLSDLKPSSTYYFRVKGVNSNGSGEFSIPTYIKTGSDDNNSNNKNKKEERRRKDINENENNKNENERKNNKGNNNKSNNNNNKNKIKAVKKNVKVNRKKESGIIEIGFDWKFILLSLIILLLAYLFRRYQSLI